MYRAKPFLTDARSLALRYAGAAALAAVAMLPRAALDPVVGPAFSLVTAQVAIAAAACLGGTGPGLVATALGTLAVLQGPGPASQLGLAVFLLGGVIVSVLGGWLHAARRRAEDARTALRGELAERETAEKRLLALVEELQRRLAELEALLGREEAARADAQQRQREVQLLADAVRGLNDSLDVERMLPAIAVAARDATRADVVRISLREATADVMASRHGAPPGGGPSPDPEPGRARLVVPIRIGERTEGLICAERGAEAPFTEREDRLLHRLARDAGLALRNAWLLAGAQSARAEAEAANRAKDEFLAMLGHELRNPLGAISNANRVLHRIGDQSSRLQEIIGRQTHHLARLVDDLLDVSRLTTGKITLEPRPADLKTVVEAGLAALGADDLAGRHEISLTAESAPVHADPTRLEQVVRNLLDNAIKFTPPGGRIAVTVGPEGDEAVLRVADSGAGIPADVLPRVFDLFVQEQRSLDRSMGGLGLGLALVKRLVGLHGGRVSAYSAGPNQGSEFVVRLPLLLDAAVPAEPRAAPPPPACSRRILIIEDNPDVRDGLRMLLESWGHRVAEAPDGRSGLAAALTSPPELALIDVGLPGLDGYSLARELRTAPATAAVFLVAVTGYGQPEDARRAGEAGFDAFLVKPVDPDELARVIAEALPAH